MHHSESQDDLWAEFRKRREEWREQRDARRAAWRERRRNRHGGCNSWGMSAADWGIDLDQWGVASSKETQELKEQVAFMQETIDKLLSRVAVLEKLAVDGDETRLAAEIEKLRRKGE
jgi:hypothetical protein